MATTPLRVSPPPFHRQTAALLRPPRAAALRYAASLGVWVVALALTLALAPYIERAMFVFFWVAVLFAAWYAGLAAALAAAVSAVVVADYFLLPPIHSLSLSDSGELMTLGIFTFASVLVSSLAAARARAQRETAEYARQTQEYAEQLQEQATELEQQTEEAQVMSEELEQTNEELQHAVADAEAARRAAESAADRARRLLAVSTGLSEATTAEKVADVIFREGTAAVGADAGSLALMREGPQGERELEVVRTRGYAAPLAERYRRFKLSPGRPLSDAIITRTPRLIESREAWRAAYPVVAAEVGEMGDMGYEAYAAVPVVSGREVLGGLSFSFKEPTGFDEATRTFLATLGEQCGLALQRAGAFEAEHRAREFTTAILASVRDGFVAFDREFRYTYVNARAAEMIGRRPGEVLGRVLWEVSPAVADSSFGPALRRVLETGRAETIEDELLPARRWAESRMYPAPDGVTVFIQDVTERRRAQHASQFLAEASRLLNASLDYEATLRAVADAAVPALGDWCAVDVVRNPEIETWPPDLERLAVVHRDPAMLALGKTLAARYPTDWSREDGMAGVLRDGKPVFVPEVTDAMLAASARDAEHLELLRKLRFTSVIAVPLVARGRTLGALTLCSTESGRRYDEADVALARDLAQRAATAVDNARLYRDAEAANRAKSEFLSVMSHELRTPLNAIAGYVELLGMGIRGPVNEAQQEDLARVRRSAKVLMSLVNDVLNFARIEAGQVDVHVEEVRIDRVLAGLEEMILPQVRAKKLEYDNDDCGEAIVVRADAERVMQILTNLLTNAVKFTPEGGRIAVSCGRTPDGSAARVRVADTGCGIPPEQLGRIFEPFVQLDRHLNRESQQGVGLGLAISRDLARLMGGELSAESEVGRGSTFTLTLPARTA